MNRISLQLDGKRGERVWIGARMRCGVPHLPAAVLDT